MNWSYCCPHCQAMLNPDRTILLIGVQEDRRCLIGLHPEPGNYEVHVPPGIDLRDGLSWDLLCPVCHESLATNDIETLCALDLLEEGGDRYRVFFSRVRGERVTFIVAGRRIERSFGEEAPKYTPLLMNKEYFF
jgi:hypothetical protein